MASNTIPGDSPITVNDFQELRTKFIKVFQVDAIDKSGKRRDHKT